MAITKLRVLAICGALAFSGCTTQASIDDAAEGNALASSTAPPPHQYESVTSEDAALAGLSDEEFTNCHDIICNKPSFRDFVEI